MMPDRTSTDDLAIDHALGLAEGAELERAQRLALTDARFAGIVSDLQERLHEINDTALPAAPPADLFRRIEAALDAPNPAHAATAKPAGLPLWASLPFWRGLGLAATAALAIGIGMATVVDRAPQQPVYVAVLQDGAGQPNAVVNAFADGTVMLVPIQSITVPQGRIIEVWTLQDRAQGPVSVGRMDQARSLKLDLKSLPKAGLNHLFEMTLEPVGGSPTGKPTGPVLSKGLTAQRL